MDKASTSEGTGTAKEALKPAAPCNCGPYVAGSILRNPSQVKALHHPERHGLGWNPMIEELWHAYVECANNGRTPKRTSAQIHSATFPAKGTNGVKKVTYKNQKSTLTRNESDGVAQLREAAQEDSEDIVGQSAAKEANNVEEIAANNDESVKKCEEYAFEFPKDNATTANPGKLIEFLFTDAIKIFNKNRGEKSWKTWWESDMMGSFETWYKAKKEAGTKKKWDVQVTGCFEKRPLQLTRLLSYETIAHASNVWRQQGRPNIITEDVLAALTGLGKDEDDVFLSPSSDEGEELRKASREFYQPTQTLPRFPCCGSIFIDPVDYSLEIEDEDEDDYDNM